VKRTSFLFGSCVLLCVATAAQAWPPPLPVYSQAQLAPTNPDLVIVDRGQSLEVYPALRATAERLPGGGLGYRTASADADARISHRALGVLFNHNLRAQGYFSGEITFKIKGGGQPVGFDAADYPGLTKVVDPGVYEALAATPAEFIQVFKRLKSRTDLEWLQPVVIYGITLGTDSSGAKTSARSAQP
jgi:hypothetical protein